MKTQKFASLLAAVMLVPLLSTPAPVADAAGDGNEVVAVATGPSHSLAIKSDGSLWTWGGVNNFGQLGYGTTKISSTPVKVMDGVITSVAAGSSHSLAIKSDGSLWAWGYNYYGQLGDGTTANKYAPIKVMEDVKSVAAGGTQTYVIKNDGSLWAWGRNNYGQFGEDTISNTAAVTTPVKLMEGVKSVAVGSDYCVFAIKNDNTLWAWGRNNYGALGDGTTENKSTPVKVMDDVNSVTSNGTSTLAVKSDNTLWAWGSNNYGQLGNGTTTDITAPLNVMTGVNSVSAGSEHTAILKTDGSLWTCGRNYYGQLGDGTATNSAIPISVMDSVKSVTAVYTHSFAIKSDGSLWAWGSNSSSMLGIGSRYTLYEPFKVLWEAADPGKVSTVKAGFVYSFAIMEDGTLWSWGRSGINSFGALGNSGSNPGRIMNNVKCVAAGGAHNVAIKTDGTLFVWGYNYLGQLGNGTTTDSHRPIKLMKDMESVAADYDITLAVGKDGSLWAWGQNKYGQLGDGTTINRTTPVKIMGDVKSVALSSQHSLALKTDGSLWAWGSNDLGQLGDGTTTSSLVPVKIMDDVKSIAAGCYSSFAIKTDGSLWAWGYNMSGLTGTAKEQKSPVPKEIMKDVESISMAGADQSFAIKTDGSLWAWGRNEYGQLGNGNTVYSVSEAVKVLDDVKCVTTGYRHTLAVKTDGSLWAWGDNEYSQLGDGTTTSSTVPILTWPSVSASSGTDSTSGEAVIVPSDITGASINLSDESIELPSDFTVAAYSLDGGKKWKKGALPTGDKFTKLFNKDITLWLINSADKKGKPTDESEYVKFPATKARPKANVDKLKATYMDDENWWLAKKSDTSGAEVYSDYEYTMSASGKVSASSVWEAVPQGGFALITGKTKTTYIFRSAAKANSDGSYTPSGKTFKLKPANYGSTTKYKINYKTEVLKLKKGDGYSTDGISYTVVTEAKGIALDVGAHITAGTVIYVRKEATGKKPPTEAQEIVPHERLELSDSTLTCQQGKITSDMKKYELYDTSRKKWVSVPKAAASGTYEIRLKTTAKGNGGNAASETGTLTVTCGEYEENKTGVIQAMITPD